MYRISVPAISHSKWSVNIWFSFYTTNTRLLSCCSKHNRNSMNLVLVVAAGSLSFILLYYRHTSKPSLKCVCVCVLYSNITAKHMFSRLPCVIGWLLREAFRHNARVSPGKTGYWTRLWGTVSRCLEKFQTPLEFFFFFKEELFRLRSFVSVLVSK